MKVGIVVANYEELKPFLTDKNYKTIQHGQYRVFQLDIAGKQVFAVKQHHVGTICASATTQMLISAFGVEVILNFGVVGALTEDIKLCSVMLVDSVVHYQMDTSEIDNCQVGRYLNFDDVAIPTSSDLLQLALSIDNSVPCVRCASGDKFVNSQQEKQHLSATFGASICDMESAGILITATNNNVKVLMVKAVSDTLIGGGSEYIENVEKAATAYAQFVTKLLEKI